MSSLLKRLARSFYSFYSELILPPLLTLFRYRLMLYQTTLSEINTRHAGSALGLLWLIIYPLLFLGTYAIVYLFIFRIRFPELSSIEYIALIFCGLIPFLGFSEALALGVPSVVSNSNLIKNTLFPIELIPAKAVLVAQATQVVGLGLLLIALCLLGKLSIYFPFLIVIWICQILFSLGLIWILSSLNVYLRDIQNLIAVATLILMLLSPIAYTEAMVPENLRPILSLNPLYYLIMAYQSVLMLGTFPPARILVPLITMSVLLFLSGFWFFQRMKKLMSDYV